MHNIDLTTGPFPMDVTTTGGSRVRLLTAAAGKVVGFVWYGETIETATDVMACAWNPSGAYGEQMGKIPQLDLLVDLALAIQATREQLAELDQQLARFGDAPAKWVAVGRAEREQLLAALQRLESLQ